jgi:hypothetical protein
MALLPSSLENLLDLGDRVGQDLLIVHRWRLRQLRWVARQVTAPDGFVEAVLTVRWT